MGVEFVEMFQIWMSKWPDENFIRWPSGHKKPQFDLIPTQCSCLRLRVCLLVSSSNFLSPSLSSHWYSPSSDQYLTPLTSPCIFPLMHSPPFLPFCLHPRLLYPHFIERPWNQVNPNVAQIKCMSLKRVNGTCLVYIKLSEIIWPIIGSSFYSSRLSHTGMMWCSCVLIPWTTQPCFYYTE